ncbi:FAD-dependent oxidoreductase [Arthrobacter sp. NPDC090010]|uniref:FAD-dependent oxidoreductase n=1 Tax=Arthrobacter sp. NPDC090010 TaxID=3363942 RepID=UPI00381D7B13
MNAVLNTTFRADRALGRLPMVRLVASALGVLVLYSMVMDALGWTEFGFPALALHLLLCVGATVLSNAACAALFRLKPYWDSSLVTAGLLYFLFWPGSTVREFLGITLAAVLASASKYALAWHGRHVFNPAALGAFVVSLTGLNAATWWVGSPIMLWAVIPLGLLALHRAGQYAAAFPFLVLSLATTVLVTLSRGLPAGTAPSLWLASQATVFFACFMLSEPLTLPPRRWQRALVGAVVGVLFSLPFSAQLGTVVLSNAPEAVLLLGNLLALLLRPRGLGKAALSARRDVADGVTEFSFQLPERLSLPAGQYVELGIPTPGLGSARRVFTPVQAGGGVLRIATRTSEPLSAAKQTLLKLPEGSLVQLSRAGGDFGLPSGDSPLLLVAGGIGVTPFLSLLGNGHDGGRDIILLYSVPDHAAAAYLPELAASGARVLLRTSRPLPEGAELPDGVEHVGAERFSAERIAELVPDAATRTALLAGTPEFVHALRGALRSAGVRKVLRDSFLGY